MPSMSIPEFQAFMLPLLKLLADGQVHRLADLRESLAQEFKLSASDREQLLPSGRSRVFDNRVAWARTDLVQAGAIESPSRGSVRVTDRGRTILAAGPTRLDRKYLGQYPEFVAFTRRTRPASLSQQAA